jgi:putative endonuclease
MLMPSSELSVMFFFVYAISSAAKQQIYIGFSKDVNKRLKEHNNGLNFSTKPYRPWELIYFEAHTNELDARRREKYLKTTQGKRALKLMLREKFNQQKVYY